MLRRSEFFGIVALSLISCFLLASSTFADAGRPLESSITGNYCDGATGGPFGYLSPGGGAVTGAVTSIDSGTQTIYRTIYSCSNNLDAGNSSEGTVTSPCGITKSGSFDSNGGVWDGSEKKGSGRLYWASGGSITLEIPASCSGQTFTITHCYGGGCSTDTYEVSGGSDDDYDDDHDDDDDYDDDDEPEPLSSGVFAATSSAHFVKYSSALFAGLGSYASEQSSLTKIGGKTEYTLPYNYRVTVNFTHGLSFTGNLEDSSESEQNTLTTNYSVGSELTTSGSWSVSSPWGASENYATSTEVLNNVKNYFLNSNNGFSVTSDQSPTDYVLKNTISFAPETFTSDGESSGSGESSASVTLHLVDLLAQSSSGVMVSPGTGTSPSPESCTGVDGSTYLCLQPNSDDNFEFTAKSYPDNTAKVATPYYVSQDQPFYIQFRHHLSRKDNYDFPLRVNYSVGGYQSVPATFYTLETNTSSSTTTLSAGGYSSTTVGTFRRFCENINYYSKKLTLLGEGVDNTGYSKICQLVYSPYNFQTDPKSDPSFENKVIELNSSTSASAKININEVYNSVVDRDPTGPAVGRSYATLTPSDIKAVVIPYVAEKDHTTFAGTVAGTADPCVAFENYFSSVSYDASIGSSYKTRENCNRILSGTSPLSPGSHDYTASFATPTEGQLSGEKTFCYVVAVNYSVVNDNNGFNWSAAAASGDQKGNETSASAYLDLDSLKSWRLSAPVCNSNFGKYYNLEIWGGSLFSGGNVSTALSHRTTSGAVSETFGNPNKTYGSWAELATVLSGVGTSDPVLIGFASGASLGYSSARKGASPSLTAPSGRMTESTLFCNSLTPLSVPNNNCGNSSTKLFGHIPLYRSGPYLALSSRYIAFAAGAGLRSGALDLSEPSSSTEITTSYGSARYVYSATNLEIYASSPLSAGSTYVVVAEGDITIAGNLTYESLGHSSIDSIPQYLIVSKNGNINIKNNVGNIDAWLIAPNGHVNTCIDGNLGTNSVGLVTGLNNCKVSGLKITGSVLTQSILPYRAYGSGTSMNTDPDYASIPAETIDYNGLTYLWGYAQSAHHSAVVTSTCQVSLPPRY
ncbi:hypothetical protein IJG76_02275 [Candidatus Saccharibacteria bacterium]|nr:hypothetical protein [Candidatus Saccharibacteria bacterium]